MNYFSKNCTKPSANFIPGRELQVVASCKQEQLTGS